MKVSVLLFAGYREAVGDSELELELPNDATVGDLARAMSGLYPRLPEDADRIVAAVNDEYQPHDYRLTQGDEVALIPPVSGGSPHILVTTAPLDPADYIELVRTGSSGAVATFLGTTRNENDGRTVTLLQYEGYRPMADKMLAKVADEMTRRWELGGVAIGHRLGRVDVGEISLVVAASAAHRAAAFEAVEYAVDRIKQIVPIWKKEHFEGGEVWIGSQDGKEFSPLGPA
jgi:molybdopterin converting factor subunit 1